MHRERQTRLMAHDHPPQRLHPLPARLALARSPDDFNRFMFARCPAGLSPSPAVLSRTNSTVHITFSYDPQMTFLRAPQPGDEEMPEGLEEAVEALAARMELESASLPEMAAALMSLVDKMKRV